MARRRWIAEEWNESTATLLSAQAKHLSRVLRATEGMRCDVVAGAKVWSARITSVSEERVVFSLEEELPAEQALPVTLLLAVFKFDRMEWAIEKATELGVRRIAPVIARRTEKHLAQASGARVERWRRIAHEAAKQSRRADLPTVDDPQPLKAALENSPGGARLLLAENERTVMLADALLQSASLEEVSLAIGPEGGWTSEEEALFSAHQWQAVSLGPRILRAETAAIAATAVVSSTLLSQ